MAIFDIFKPKTEEEVNTRFRELYHFNLSDYNVEKLPRDVDLDDVFSQYYKLTHKVDGSVKYSAVLHNGEMKFGDNLEDVRPKFEFNARNNGIAQIFGYDVNESKMDLEGYIFLLDRLLEREGLSSAERDSIFNDPNNIDLISQSFEKRVHPSQLLKELDREPVRAMYSSSTLDEWELNEKKKKPTTKKGKESKFKKVMHEFGKGELKPYHAKKNLKSKKQGGSKRAHKQALAIAFSEAGLSEAVKNKRILSVQQQNELNKDIPLTNGQKYAVDFLKSKGLTLISTPRQIKQGTLQFSTPDREEWLITNTGYIRKRDWKKETYAMRMGFHDQPQWNVLYSHFGPQYQHGGKQIISDDEYMDLAEKLSEKFGRAKVKEENNFRKSYVDRLYKMINNQIKDKLAYSHYNEWQVTKEEVAEAVKKLYDQYVK